MPVRRTIQQALDNFGKQVVKGAKLNVGATRTIEYNDGKKKRGRLSNTGTLLDSIAYKLSVQQSRDSRGRFKSGNDIEMSFYMEDYGKFLDEGVDGTEHKVKGGTRFGFSSKQPPIKDIRGWMKQRNFRLRDLETNKFKPTTESGMRSAAFAISKKIKERGLPKTSFFTTPFNLAYEQLPDEIAEILGNEFFD